MIDRSTGREQCFALARWCAISVAIRGRRRRDLEYLRPMRRAQRDPADAMFLEQVDQALLQAVTRVALHEVEAEARELARRRRTFDRHCAIDAECSRRASSCSTIDPAPTPTSSTIKLARARPETTTCSRPFSVDQRPLAGVDRVDAHLAASAGRCGTAGPRAQAGAAGPRLTLRRQDEAQPDAGRSDLSTARQNCNRRGRCIPGVSVVAVVHRNEFA